jgi:DNA-directed RNA polymerase subunit RPC12/RpoP
MGFLGINCSKCGSKTKVLRTLNYKDVIIRDRVCINCHTQIQTEEVSIKETEPKKKEK